MIYKNNKTINEWYFNDAELIKVYKNGAICYYKMVLGETPHQEPCFAVVDDITQYSDTEFIDVYDKATEKWYKLNNLNQYEQYGVYGSGRTITYYEGKLTVDNGYEYEWDGSQWGNLGEVSGSTSTLPAGYTAVEWVGSTGNSAYFNTQLAIGNAVGNTFSIDGTISTEYQSGSAYLISNELTTVPYPNFTWRWNGGSLKLDTAERITPDVFLNLTDNGDGTSGFTIYSEGVTLSSPTSVSLFAGLNGTSPWRYGKGKLYNELKITKNDVLVADYIPCKRDSDNRYGFYDLVANSFNGSSNSNQLAGGDIATVYPKYYAEKDEPENNVVFEDMEEALAYECPWVGMKATIDGVRYVFSGDSQSGYEWVERTSELPDVPFILNYNAKNYDATNRKLLKTEGQLRDSDAVCNYGYNIVDHSADGYITVTGDTRMIISGTPYMNRNNTQTGCTMTIVSKVKTNSGYSILTNRNNNMNWMWRYPSNGIFLHGSTSYNNPKYLVSTTGQPITASIRISYDGSVKQQLNDWTNNGSYNGDFQYGSESTGNSAMFCDYTTNNSEFWKGDFYWVYMSFNVLTDEQIQQVIDYNENLE